MPPDTNGWSRAEMFVLEELKRLSAEVAANGAALAETRLSLEQSIANIRVNVERKSVIWSTVTSAIVSAVAMVFRR